MHRFDIMDSSQIRLGITDRTGGVSDMPYGDMNTSFYGLDQKAHVMENIKRTLDTLNIDARIIFATKQVHGTQIVMIDDIKNLDRFSKVDTTATALESYELYTIDSTDGLITSRSDVVLMTFYADCVPLMFFDPIHACTASVHSGWRGTKDRIGQVAVEKMIRSYGSKVEDIRVAIGHSAGACCYEVDFPVIEAFEKTYPKAWLENAVFPKDYGKYHIDLKWLNKMLMLSLGIKESHIEVDLSCTICHPEKYHSHRFVKGGPRGTMSAFTQLVK